MCEIVCGRWQMVNDLDTLSSQPEVQSMTRQEFKQKVIDMVKEKWIPRNREYVQNGLDKLRREMAALQDGSFRALIEDISVTVRENVGRSLELVDQLKNASEEDRKLIDERKASAADAAAAAATVLAVVGDR